MVNISIYELARLAQDCLQRASQVADQINLPSVAKAFTEAYQYSRNAEGSQSISDDPYFARLDHFEGMQAWGAMLSFDLRKSSSLPIELGARGTYILMHTYLPTMLAVLRAAQATVVGLRGDGAIAMFGVVKYPNGKRVTVTAEQAADAVVAACDCGAVMIKTMSEAVNPVLRQAKLVGDLQMGVGIDVGEFVATNIGLGTANELTAYGHCVNTACKRSDLGNNQVVMTNLARKLFPTKQGGRTRLTRHAVEHDAYILRYPEDYNPMKK